jgi:hypothetical protein
MFIPISPNGSGRDSSRNGNGHLTTELFYTYEGKSYASVEIDGFTQCMPIRSPEFRVWLVDQVYRQSRCVPSSKDSEGAFGPTGSKGSV